MTEFSVIDEADGVSVVRPTGRLNMVAAPAFTATVDKLISSGRSRIVVDLSATEFMDSSGLGSLVSCLKKARQAGGDLRLATPGTQVQTVLELTNLSRVLRPAESLPAALAGFES